MAERKFRVDKLYKLTKIIVIITSSLLLLHAFQGSWLFQIIDTTWANDLCKNQTDGFCKLSALDELQKARQYEFKIIALVILIPVLFFGGTKLFKYLFPLVKENK